jgi:hypothetical protein
VLEVKLVLPLESMLLRRELSYKGRKRQVYVPISCLSAGIPRAGPPLKPPRRLQEKSLINPRIL